jgi:serpin B
VVQVRHSTRAAEILYGRGAFAMTIILPPDGVAPADLLLDLDASSWDEWMDGFEETGSIGRVVLPRFRIEWEKTLSDDLDAMGMDQAFDDRADSHGCSSSPSISRYPRSSKRRSWT